MTARAQDGGCIRNRSARRLQRDAAVIRDVDGVWLVDGPA